MKVLTSHELCTMCDYTTSHNTHNVLNVLNVSANMWKVSYKSYTKGYSE
jgi:hypothetical protein